MKQSNLMDCEIANPMIVIEQVDCPKSWKCTEDSQRCSQCGKVVEPYGDGAKRAKLIHTRRSTAAKDSANPDSIAINLEMVDVKEDALRFV